MQSDDEMFGFRKLFIYLNVFFLCFDVEMKLKHKSFVHSIR